MNNTAGKREKTISQLSLKDSETRYRRLFEAAQDGILILDAETGAITDVNPFLIKMLGYSHEEFIQKKLWEVGAFQDIEASREAFEALQKNEYIRYENLPLRRLNGQLIQVEFVSNVYLAGDKKVIQCNIRDITERKTAQDALLASETRLREKSVRDYLTGLFNRRYLEETLDRELMRASRKQFSLGVIMLDVDDFKHFNDTYGHPAGDMILKELGSLLLHQFRGEDIACRYGGDEFIIVLPDASLEVTHQRASLICEYTKLFDLQFMVQPFNVVTLSVGVAVFPENGLTRTDILKSVDNALYAAKRKGRGQVATAESFPLP